MKLGRAALLFEVLMKSKMRSIALVIGGGGVGRFSDKQYLPFFHQIVFHIQEVIASVPVNDELRLE